MIIVNERASFSSYPPDLSAIMNIARARQCRDWLAAWPMQASSTPLYSLPEISRSLRVASVHIKDESVRSPLGSFKVLGASLALVRLVLRLWSERSWTPEKLLLGAYADVLQEMTVISATDGNHGRALAAAAKSLGCRCVIVLHAHVSQEREQAIAAYGAEIVRIAGNYDDSVMEAARLASEEGWHVVSDTSYDGYEEIPRDVMQGYGVIALEAIEQSGAATEAGCPFTHVFLQAGVGGLPAGVGSFLWEYYGKNRPRLIVVEPEQADCLYQSACAGRAAKASGSVDSVMAGLACGETSPLAWRFLEGCVDAFLTILDEDAVAAMRRLATGGGQDIPIVSGESGAAGLAGLIALRSDDAACESIGLDTNSRVLLVSTEGATAPSVYHRLVGEPAESVMARQRAWNSGQAAANA